MGDSSTLSSMYMEWKALLRLEKKDCTLRLL